VAPGSRQPEQVSRPYQTINIRLTRLSDLIRGLFCLFADCWQEIIMGTIPNTAKKRNKQVNVFIILSISFQVLFI